MFASGEGRWEGRRAAPPRAFVALRPRSVRFLPSSARWSDTYLALPSPDFGAAPNAEKSVLDVKCAEVRAGAPR